MKGKIIARRLNVVLIGLILCGIFVYGVFLPLRGHHMAIVSVGNGGALCGGCGVCFFDNPYAAGRPDVYAPKC